jgi:L-fucose mutarotase/ribose pyranase (RbsD/FucU family)
LEVNKQESANAVFSQENWKENKQDIECRMVYTKQKSANAVVHTLERKMGGN